MTVYYKCDICELEVKKPIRVGWSLQICWKCWKDKKKWPVIHKKFDKQQLV